MKTGTVLLGYKSGIGATKKALATSPSLEKMTDLINKYFHSTSFYLEPKGENKYSVHNKNGILSSYIVTKKGNRYRFEEA